MEDTLREKYLKHFQTLTSVLILVLMEDTLRDEKETRKSISYGGLNPCFNGRYSQRNTTRVVARVVPLVLILVLMEDTLRGVRVERRWGNRC